MFKKNLTTNTSSKELELSGDIFKESIGVVDFKEPNSVVFSTKKGNIYSIENNKVTKLDLSKTDIIKPEAVKYKDNGSLLVEDLYNKNIVEINNNNSSKIYSDIRRLQADGYKYRTRSDQD